MAMQMQGQTVVAIQPGVPVTSGIPQNLREWSTGLMDCCSDIGSCCYGYFCLPCLMCSVAGRMGEPCPCITVCCCYGTSLAMRVKMRSMHGITGAIWKDHCAVGCCTPCAICQMDRELKTVGL